MRITKRTAGRLVTLAVGIAAAASVAAAVSAAAFARTTGSAQPGGPTGIAPAACQASHLSLRLVGTDTGVGTTALTVAIANHSAKACTLTGYPSLSLIRANGAPVASPFSHGSGGWFAGQKAGSVPVAPAGQASFFITYRDFSPVTGHPGPAVSALRVRLPGVAGQFTVPVRFAPYGPISVSPIRAGARKE
jgi:Protein of unknown function (DUF4232)